MQFLDITLESLLTNENIKSIFVNDVWYFKYADVNDVFDNNFKFSPTKTLLVEIDNKKTLEKFISFPEIEDHINHNKSKPSFENNIDIALGLKVRKL
ncbi:hypothetical protein [Flavobacterium eburneipallidum]|uniref:hypothetical protein n=1 Tax=Flavobacterium eburneipallidum TaxID=3003263 RepID=UPI0022AC1275|nr:hypothetical protein [Flavobacterium eburneipallidum]